MLFQRHRQHQTRSPAAVNRSSQNAAEGSIESDPTGKFEFMDRQTQALLIKATAVDPGIRGWMLQAPATKMGAALSGCKRQGAEGAMPPRQRSDRRNTAGAEGINRAVRRQGLLAQGTGRWEQAPEQSQQQSSQT